MVIHLNNNFKLNIENKVIILENISYLFNNSLK